ncbi:hypothetical protein A2714_00920 [Candidatus Woesebacteria bacterium RIFCSPHIGHO2_01_FULL_38_9]|uniref:Uncharacterized protein n=2 Tax=Candidatus Woeseibacteriota TaxID=1752722 RepID=A0A1F7XZJ3_9BACT|nr:MAG: hypothetical protein A2714_00920 [Candidatus Woesebacteria bacterium RIFCSPHIGHO2_01_FULL_38_9]OGM59729.1 MAG: hypothetical protein A3A75_02125 [Candidatus Woesebacteria bacterium RIFCSPLOWO2_01_FULL_39_10]
MKESGSKSKPSGLSMSSLEGGKDTRVGDFWECNLCGKFSRSGKLHLWQVLPDFGEHNSLEHGSTMQAHVILVSRGRFQGPR